MPTVEDLVVACLEAPAGERTTKLEALCASHPDLAADLRRMFGHLAQMELLTGGSDPGHEGPPAWGLPEQLGSYRLETPIGRGGMGVVYRARQTSLGDRLVAIKLLRPDLVGSRKAQARFVREALLASRLDHPNVCGVFEVGQHEGLAWLAMPFLDGQTLALRIAEARDRRPRLPHALPQRRAGAEASVDDWLAAFVALARGLAHAHERGLLHRDVKPANIIVQSSGEPVLLDFGLAREVEPGSRLTLSQDLIGTPAYMAPEQAAQRDVDARTDVYGLGASLYECLTLELPHPAPTREEMLRRILNDPAPDPRQRAPWLPRPVADVVYGALEPDPARRYQTAGAFADDLQRLLDLRPVTIRRPTWSQRAVFWMRRNPWPVAVGVLLVVATAVAVVLASLERTSARAAMASQQAAQKSAERAEARANELARVLEFQESIWSQADAESMGAHLRRMLLAAAAEPRRAEVEGGLTGVNFTDLALEALDKNLFEPIEKSIATRFEAEPLVKARLLATMALNFRDVGLVRRAAKLQAEALEIRRRTLGDDHEDTLTSMFWLGFLHEKQGELPEARRLYKEALERGRRVGGADHRAAIRALGGLGSLLHVQGRLALAEPLVREALERSRRVFGNDDPATLGTISQHGVVLAGLGRLAEAEPLYREAWERSQRVLDPDDGDALTILGNLGGLLMEQSKLVEAEPFIQAAVEKSQRILGSHHARTLTAMNNLGALLRQQGRLREASSVLRDTLDGRRRTLGDDDPTTLNSMVGLAAVLDSLGRTRQAETLYREALERSQRRLGDRHRVTLNVLTSLGSMLRDRGEPAKAEPLLRLSVERSREELGDTHVDTLRRILNLARLYLPSPSDRQGRLPEAEALCREAATSSRLAHGDHHRITLSAVGDLGLVLAAKGALTEAEPLVREAADRARSTLGKDHPETLTRLSHLGYLLGRQGKWAEASPVYREALEGSRRAFDDDHPLVRDRLGNLGRSLLSQGELTEAEPLLAEQLDRTRRALGDDSWETIVVATDLGRLLVLAKRHGEAVNLLAPAEPAARAALRGGLDQGLAMFLRTLGQARTGSAQPQDFPAAEAALLESYAMSSKAANTADATRACRQALVELYTAWHACCPLEGLDRKAAEWRTRAAGEGETQQVR